MVNENFSGYVLAGGKSSRMGTDKAFLEANGKTFIEHAVDVLKPVCAERISIVLNVAQANFSEILLTGVPYIFDAFENRGALGGIHAALRNCSSEWAVILAVDLPFVSSGIISFLAQTALNSSKEIAAVIPKQPDGRLQPLCGVYRPRICAEKLDELLQTGESLSVRGFLENFPVTFIDSAKLSSESNSWFLNVNTPADYASLKPGK